MRPTAKCQEKHPMVQSFRSSSSLPCRQNWKGNPCGRGGRKGEDTILEEEHGVFFAHEWWLHFFRTSRVCRQKKQSLFRWTRWGRRDRTSTALQSTQCAIVEWRKRRLTLRSMDRNSKISNLEDEATRGIPLGETVDLMNYSMRSDPKNGPYCQRNKNGKTWQSGNKKRPDCKRLTEKEVTSTFSPADRDYLKVIAEASTTSKTAWFRQCRVFPSWDVLGNPLLYRFFCCSGKSGATLISNGSRQEGHPPEFHTDLVHKPTSITEAMKIPEAQAAGRSKMGQSLELASPGTPRK